MRPTWPRSATTLEKQPNRFWSVYGAAQAAKAAGDTAAARTYYQLLLAITPHADEPRRAALVTARDAVGKN